MSEPTDAESLSNHALCRRAEELAAMYADDRFAVANPATAAVLRELSKRFQAACWAERERWRGVPKAMRPSKYRDA